MINRLTFESFDRTLHDIMKNVVNTISNLSFGGRTMVFGGDFCQFLSVVPKGGRAYIIHATIKSLPLVQHFEVE